MKLSEIYQIADEIAPKSISDEMCAKYDCYDNSGILVDVDEEITGILFSLDLSEGAIDEAIKEGANLIITHHPAIYGKISRIDYYDEGLLGKKLIRCIRHGISVLAMHLNLDSARGGIDENLMQGVRLSTGDTTGVGTQPTAIQMPLSSGAYGRVYEINEVTLSALVTGLKKTFQTNRVETYGEEKRKITRVASFCGSGADEKSVAFAAKEGADVILSSDFKHHVLSMAIEKGLAVITLTHYASENYGFRKYYEKIGQRVNIPCYYHEDSYLL